MALIYDNNKSFKNKKYINTSENTQYSENKNEKVSTNNELNLTVEELEYIFNLIKKSNFSGIELDIIYRIVIKLQNHYILLKR